MSTAATAPARRRRGLPVVRQLRQAVGLQRGMLVAGLVLTGIFLLTAALADLLAPYGYNQLRDADGPFGAQQSPSGDHWLGTTVGGYDVLSRVVYGTRTALAVIVVGIVLLVATGADGDLSVVGFALLGLGAVLGFAVVWSYDRFA